VFVRGPNVVSSATPIPDSFVEGKRYVAHGKDPYFPGWTDTAQVEYRRAATRAAMASRLRAIAERCDGVRCDMAMLVLADVFDRTWQHVPFARESGEEFWTDAIAAVRATHRDFVVLAEAYWGLEQRLCDLGFDYAYDKELYDRVVHDQPLDVAPHLYCLGAQNARRAHFLENHDEPRAALLPIELHRAAALLALGLPGMRFLHHGQLDGARRSARIQLRRRAVEPIDPDVRALYDRLLPALRASSVGQGEAELLAPRAAWPDNPTHAYFTIVKWPHDLVVVNMAPHRAQCRVDMRGRYELVDRLGGERWQRDGELFLDLPARGAQLFAVSE
jgi:hypothetical protein